MAKRSRVPKLPTPTAKPGDTHETVIQNSLAQAQQQLAEQKRGHTTSSFNDYFRMNLPTPDYKFGTHTKRLIADMQEIADIVGNGGCVYRIYTMPPRHGKSDVISRRFPPYCLTRFPDFETILATYAASLSEDMAHQARQIFERHAGKHGLKLSEDRNQLGAFRIEGHNGGMVSVGLGGSMTGRGAHFFIIDDYCKNRAEAESETIRDGWWDSFRNDCLTRLAPNHAVIILATPWHEDDLIGRIQKEMKKNPDFPQFELVRFPAYDAATDKYLFEERFPREWYKRQRAAVGEYGWQSLYMCDPKPRQGAMLRADLIEIVDKLPEKLRFSRGWDLASTEKERVKDDPDYTVGVKSAYDGEYLYVADVVRGQWSALERDKRIMDTARADGPGCTVYIEVVAGYRDTFTRVKALLSGKCSVRAVSPKGDKMQRMSDLEPLFEAKKVRILKAPWNSDFIAELLAFPNVSHDDQCDGLHVSCFSALTGKRRMSLSF